MMEPIFYGLIAAASSTSSPERVMELQRALLNRPELLLAQPEEHLFLPGLYIRKVINPKGSLVVTMKHATRHPYFVLRGRLRVKNLETGELVELVAPCAGVTEAGTQRVLIALEETEFITVHANPDNETDLAKLEARLIVRQELEDGRTAGEIFRERLAFRELTASVIAAERPGTWSDWTPEEQALYRAGDWKAFSVSRGYSAEEIAEYGRWREAVLAKLAAGHDPYVQIADLAAEAAVRNIAADHRGEILLSSHAPHEERSR